MTLRIFLIAAVFPFASCTTLKTDAFATQKPVFDPIDFFTGTTSSSGVRENRRGKPVQQVFTKTKGVMKNGSLHLEQDLTFGTGSTATHSHRSWKLRKIDDHHFQGCANDMIGTAKGEAHGNAFDWSFPLSLSPGNPLADIRMSQWMYLQPDGKTMLNHTTISKAGIVVGQVTEQFRKGE